LYLVVFICLLFLAHSEEGVLVFDVTVPPSPVNVNSFGDVGYATAIAIEDDVLYVVDLSGDISTFDYSVSKTDPPFMGSGGDGLSYFATSVIIAGNYACVSEDDLGLFVYDVFDPIRHCRGREPLHSKPAGNG